MRRKRIPGHPRYSVTETGVVYGPRGKLKPWYAKHRGGYPVVGLDGKHICVHTLVLITWVGPKPEGCEALHADGDPLHNSVSNLSWGTRTDNVRDMYQHGTWAKTRPSQYGEKHHAAKLTDEEADEIRRRYVRGNATALAAEYGVAVSTVCRIVKGQIRSRS